MKKFVKKHNLTENQFLGVETVGGSLDLQNLTSIPDGFNPTVGDYLDLGNLTMDVSTKPYGNPILSWENGKYILCDRISTEVLSKKKGHYFVRKLDSKEKMHIITDGENTHSHGKSLKQANEDLQFKIASKKLKNTPIQEDSLLTVKHYRLITGAGDAGVRDFMNRNSLGFEVINGETKEINTVKAKDLLPLLIKNKAYGIEKFKSLIVFK
jgi:hypothetical protein